MTDSHRPSPPSQEAPDPAQLLATHLSRYPADLIDSYRLLRRFRASSEDFQRALQLVEQRVVVSSSKTDS